MYKTAIAIAIPADTYQNPFKALVDSVVNLSTLVFDFMYGTRERCNLTFYFAIGLTLLGFAMESSQAMASMNCPVTSL